MSLGVFDSAKTPTQNGKSASGKPACASVGRSGSEEMRLLLLTASAPDASVADERHRRQRRREEEINPPGQKLGECLLHAAERNLLRFDLGAQPEALGIDMRGAAMADRCVVERAGFRLRGGDQLLDRFVFRRRHHQQERRVDERDHAGEVALGVVRQRLMSGGKYRERRRMGEQRVAVRVGVGDRRRGEQAGAAAAVVDDERLAHLLRDLLEHRAADEVDRASRRDRHRDPHRFGGPSQVGVRRGDWAGDCARTPLAAATRTNVTEARIAQWPRLDICLPRIPCGCLLIPSLLMAATMRFPLHFRKLSAGRAALCGDCLTTF